MGYPYVYEQLRDLLEAAGTSIEDAYAIEFKSNIQKHDEGVLVVYKYARDEEGKYFTRDFEDAAKLPPERIEVTSIKRKQGDDLNG